jgi:hypothetical protein
MALNEQFGVPFLPRLPYYLFVSLQHEQFCPSAPVCLLFTQEAQITYAGSSDPGDLAKLSSSCLSFPICAVGVLVTASVLWLLPRIE